jgi:hypothetical protein
MSKSRINKIQQVPTAPKAEEEVDKRKLILEQLRSIFDRFRPDHKPEPLYPEGPKAGDVRRSIEALNIALNADSPNWRNVYETLESVISEWEKWWKARDRKKSSFRGRHSDGVIVLKRVPQLWREVRSIGR